MVNPLARQVGERLSGQRRSLVLAESCTGGLVAAMVTDMPGSSAYFRGGVVSYTDALKESLLGVPAELLRTRGAVSREVAQAMAEGARARLGADLAASVTGIAGPSAEGTQKPVGLTFIGVAGERGTRVEEFRFSGDRWSIRRQAAEAVLQLLLDETEAS